MKFLLLEATALALPQTISAGASKLNYEVVQDAAASGPVSSLTAIENENNQGGSYSCEAPCPSGQFCGSDLACHAYSCEDWYRFAGENWTNYDPELPLTCVDRSQFNPEFEGLTNAAVIFGCTGFGGSLPAPPKAIYQAFTRKCTRADGDALATFTCYDMAEKTNFQPFVVDAQSAKIAPCTLDGSPDVPSFIYQAQALRQKDSTSYFASFDTGNATVEFDREKGMDTMFANLTISQAVPTPSPTTTSPATPSPTMKSGSTYRYFSPLSVFCCGLFYTIALRAGL